MATDPGRPDRPAPAYKRPFDLAVLALLAPAWVPLARLTALAVRVADGSPVLYRQRRLGRDARAFDMLKFRTMPVGSEHATGPVWSTRGDRRATALGRRLRRLRLDELPQVVNVLRGEMSLVGPRPERPELAARFERCTPGFVRRVRVAPGIAGLAQARRGDTATPRQKLRYDLLYAGAMGPWLDCRLMAACAWRVLARALSPRPPRWPAERAVPAGPAPGGGA